VYLLHGVTGSGKTEIYLRAIDLALRQGKSALFLVPEIALTPQTVRRVAARFPGKVAVIHSGLSEGERYDTWRRCRDGLVQVIVGARSALFAPLPNIGVIILDESHDSSYKQSPPIPPPYYHARQVAEAMIRQHGAVLIMGTATPDIETAYRAERGEIRRLELAQRIMGHRVRVGELSERAGVLPRYQHEDEAQDAMHIDLPPVRVVDMRDELRAGNTSIFSTALQSALSDVLNRREQAILFLNRRGQATYVFCRDCGHVALCPRCDSPLTYHRAGDMLRCHRCNHSEPEPTLCPACRSRRIKFFGAGTQHVEMALAELFPRVRIARWDADTADSPEAHEAILQRFIDRKTDVMIGTQMVTKGLDLPLVTLVGVISADTAINLPDFRAGERTFQLLTQVAGRAGRGLLGGQVLLQTYNPQHYAIQAASRHDFHGFYQQEIAYRKRLGYPPFRRMIRILFRFPTELQAMSEAERAANMIRHRMKMLNMSGTELIGPAPCFFGRENKFFRWHVLLRGPDPVTALEGLNLPKGWFVDVDPVDIL
jgi:primosomal protein N' (replication factor Y)